jgi:hypothetical protein
MLRRILPPRPLNTKIAAICYQQRCLFGKSNRCLLRRFMPNHQLNVPPTEGFLHLTQPFQKEGIMPFTRLWIAVCNSKKGDNWQRETVCLSYRKLQSMVAFGTLCLLHPVENIFTGHYRAVIKALKALLLNHLPLLPRMICKIYVKKTSLATQNRK